MKISKLLVITSAAMLLSSCSFNPFHPSTSGSSSTTGQTTGSTSGHTSGSSSSSGSTSGSTSIDPSTKKKHTILIYMCGADLESESKMATANINEMLTVSGLGNDVNVVLETGGASKWWKNNSNITPSSSVLTRYHIAGGKMIQDGTVTKASMGKSNTLSSFVEYGLKNFPAERTGLVLWNHGGAMTGCCFDENYSNDSLSATELTDGVKSGMTAAGVSDKLEWIGYDACLMGVADVAASNASNFNYMVSSQESEPGEGWDYDVFLKNFVNNPNSDTKALLTNICTSYVTKVGDTYKEYGYPYSGHNDATLAVLDLSKANAWISAFNDVCGTIKSSFTNKSALNSLLTGPMQFGWSPDSDYSMEPGDYCYGVFDAKGVLNNMKSKYSASITTAQNALNDLVIYNGVGTDFSGKACGLSVYANSYTGYTPTSLMASGLSNWKTLNNVNTSGYLSCTQTYIGPDFY